MPRRLPQSFMRRRFTPVRDMPGLTVTGIQPDHVTRGAPAIGLDLPMPAQSGWDPATTVTGTTADIGVAKHGFTPTPGQFHLHQITWREESTHPFFPRGR